MAERIPGFILVRTHSSRLPQKCLLPFGDGNVLEHVVVRAVHFGFDPVICTTEEKSDDIMADISRKHGWKIFRGSTKDKIKRLYEACQRYHIDAFVTLDADDPFFDPQADQDSFQWLKQGYDFVVPPENYYCGGIGFSVRAPILKRTIDEKDTSDSEMMWALIERLAGIKMISLPLPKPGMQQIRLTLDYEEDYHLLLAVLRMLGPMAQSADIERLFARNPDLYKINWFRQQQWKTHQQQAILQR